MTSVREILDRLDVILGQLGLLLARGARGATAPLAPADDPGRPVTLPNDQDAPAEFERGDRRSA